MESDLDGVGGDQVIVLGRAAGDKTRTCDPRIWACRQLAIYALSSGWEPC